jgi:hypothetical protein
MHVIVMRFSSTRPGSTSTLFSERHRQSSTDTNIETVSLENVKSLIDGLHYHVDTRIQTVS